MASLIEWCRREFRYYVVFSKPIAFILGLIFSYKLVEKVLFNVFITRLTEDWEFPNLSEAAIIVNLQQGTSATVQIIFAIVADAWTGSFVMLFCSTAIYITGLYLTYLETNGEFLRLGRFYLALVLMTLAKAANETTLQWFLRDQVRGPVKEKPPTRKEEEKVESRGNFWWNSVAFLAAIFALFGPLKDASFWYLAEVLAIVKFGALVFFLFGVKFYTYGRPRGIHRAFTKRIGAKPANLRLPPGNSNGGEMLSRVPSLRGSTGAANNTSRGERVSGVKFLLRMIPMWTTFIVFSLVSASGSTFFLEEASTLTDATFPILFFTNIQRFTEFLVTEISDYLLGKLIDRNANIKQRVLLARIGTGMVFSVLCCIAAWRNAVDRLSLVRVYGNPMGYMSVYRLTPQYILLAFMGGLAQDGLESFFDSQVAAAGLKYAASFGGCALGIGNFLSVFCVIISGWIKKETNTSRLDKYYAMLAIVSSVNVGYYCLVACWYGDKSFKDEDGEGDEEEEGLDIIGDVQELVVENVQLVVEGTEQEVK